MRFKGNSPEVFDLPLSGQIDLNAIGVEAGQNNNSQTGLEDAAVRDLIGKGSGAQNALSEYYGATSSDAVDGWVPEDGTNGYWFPTGGNRDRNGPWSKAISNGSSSIATIQNAHSWPLSATDGQPHVIGPDHPDLNGPAGYDWGTAYGAMVYVDSGSGMWNQVRCKTDNSSRWGLETEARFPGMVGLGWKRNGLVFHAQKIKAGSHRFQCNIKAGGMTGGIDASQGDRSQTVIRLIEWEKCTPASGSHAVGNGGNKVTELFSFQSDPFTFDPMYRPTGYGGSWTKDMDATVTTIYEWLFFEVVHSTQNQKPQDFDTSNWKIT